MPNQIVFGATITPTSTPMEVTINFGSTFTPLVFSTISGNQQGTLTGVPAATYATGQLGLRAQGFPNTALYNVVSVIVTAAQTISAPGVPTATATVSGNSIIINATTVSDGGTTITGYAVYRNGSLLVPNVALPYVDSSPLATGVAYNYTVAAINRVGSGPQSAVVSATVPTPTFNTTLNPGEAILTVTYGGAVGTQFKFNAPLSANANPNPAFMDVFLAGTQVGHVDFNGADIGTPCAVVVNGTQYLTTFAQGDVTIS